VSDLRSEMARLRRKAASVTEPVVCHHKTPAMGRCEPCESQLLDDFARNLTAARVVEDELERIARKTRRDGTP
jgi:hypothetical protein